MKAVGLVQSFAWKPLQSFPKRIIHYEVQITCTAFVDRTCVSMTDCVGGNENSLLWKRHKYVRIKDKMRFRYCQVQEKEEYGDYTPCRQFPFISRYKFFDAVL